MAEHEQQDVIATAYGKAAQVIAQAFTPAHVATGTLAETRARFISLPVTMDETAWESALVERRDGDPTGAAIRFKLDLAPQADGDFNIWIDRDSQCTVSLDQLVLGALYGRLFRPTYAVAAAVTEDREQLTVARRAERSRLLALVDPDWGGPLGRLAITQPAPFDHVDSHDALVAAHAAIVDRVTAASGSTTEHIASILEPPWTLDPQDFTFNGGHKEHLVGGFSADAWEFDYTWRERSGTHGRSVTAEELLWGCTRSLGAFAEEADASVDALLAAADPAWRSDYVPTRMWDRSLRLR